MISIFSNLIEDTYETPKKNPPRFDLRTKPEDTDYSVPQDQKVTQDKTAPMPTISHDGVTGFKRTAKASVAPKSKDTVLMGFNSDDWVFSQVTAISSVNTEFDGHTITQASLPYINQNYNAWTSDILNKYYQTFIGGHNYRNHEQDPRKSYGVIIDAVKRVIQIPDSEETSIYIDLLIATNKHKDPQWADAIQKRQVKFVSMGCESSAFKCTKCGNTSFSSDDDCKHLKYELGMNYIGDNGKKVPVAILVTDEPNPEDGKGFLEFIEISFLSVDPAFTSTVSSHVLDVDPNQTIWTQIPRKYSDKEAFQVWSKYIKTSNKQ